MTEKIPFDLNPKKGLHPEELFVGMDDNDKRLDEPKVHHQPKAEEIVISKEEPEEDLTISEE